MLQYLKDYSQNQIICTPFPMSISDFYVRREKSFPKKLTLPSKADFPQTLRAAHTRMYISKVLSIFYVLYR